MGKSDDQIGKGRDNLQSPPCNPRSDSSKSNKATQTEPEPDNAKSIDLSTDSDPEQDPKETLDNEESSVENKRKAPSLEDSDVSYSSSSNEATNSHTLKYSETTTQTGSARDKPWYQKATEAFEKSMKTNLNPVSFVGRKDPKSTKGDATDEEGNTALEVQIDPTQYCEHCKQLLTHCHRRTYHDFITKKLFWMYRNQVEQPGWDEIKKQMRIAYNEHRRSRYHERFGFYDGEEWELPGCLENFSFTIEFHLNLS